MKTKEKFRKFVSDRGLYIGLGLCAVAVGVSGWLFCRQPAPKTAVAVSPTDVRAAAGRSDSSVPDHRSPLFSHEAEPGVKDPESPGSQGEDSTDQQDPKLPEEKGSQTLSLRVVPPLEGETDAVYSMDKLSYNPTTRDWRTHAGVDILAPAGTDVLAAAEGVVLAVYDDDLLGRTVSVRHAGGWVSYYSNLAQEADVMAGDKVSAGQVLGQVGSTALLEIGQQPHLHFAVCRNNVPRDPEEFLKNGD